MSSMDEDMTADTDGAAAKRARVVAVVSLDDDIDYSILDELGIDVLKRSSDLEPETELAGKKAALDMLAHYGLHEDVPRSESGDLKRLRARWGPQKRREATSRSGATWRRSSS